MAGVYQIYNKETNKRYIGSSINIERRLEELIVGIGTMLSLQNRRLI